MQNATILFDFFNGYIIVFRTFSRVVVIPFKKLPKVKNAVKKRLALQTEIKGVIGDIMKSVGVILELRQNFANCQDDAVFSEVLNIIKEVDGLDMRTQCNYALVLYSTTKVIHV